MSLLLKARERTEVIYLHCLVTAVGIELGANLLNKTFSVEIYFCLFVILINYIIRCFVCGQFPVDLIH